MKPVFTPILEDVSIDFALTHLKWFSNEPRNILWGSPVFAFPPNTPYGDPYRITPGMYYKEGYNYYDKKGKKNNCVYQAGVWHYYRSGIIDTSVVGKAVDTFKKYKGRKTGGEYDNTYLGDVIQPGDWLIFADDKDEKGDGHIITCEKKYSDRARFSDGAYSDKDCYNGKTCIVYDIPLKDLYTGKRITIRPQAPFKEYVKGVCHTGDEYEQKQVELPTPVERNIMQDQLYIGDVVLNVRTEPNTKSLSIGKYNRPSAYFNVYEVSEQADYVWYRLGDGVWVAGVEKTNYYPKQIETVPMETTNYKLLYEQAQEKLNKVKDYTNKIQEIL